MPVFGGLDRRAHGKVDFAANQPVPELAGVGRAELESQFGMAYRHFVYDGSHQRAHRSRSETYAHGAFLPRGQSTDLARQERRILGNCAGARCDESRQLGGPRPPPTALEQHGTQLIFEMRDPVAQRRLGHPARNVCPAQAAFTSIMSLRFIQSSPLTYVTDVQPIRILITPMQNLPFSGPVRRSMVLCAGATSLSVLAHGRALEKQ